MHTDPDIPEVVAGGLSELEATVLIEHLRAQGFVALPWGTHLLFYGGPDDGSIRIVVRRSEAESARRALNAFRSGPYSLAPIVTVRPFH